MTEFTGWANAAGSSLPTTKPSFENSTLSKAFRSCYRSWLPAWSDYLKAVSLFITPDIRRHVASPLTMLLNAV